MENRYERNKSIDILKGIGIILMVMGHTNFGGKSFIYLFHMSIFFIASGYCYKNEYSENIDAVKKFIKKRLVALYVPYVIWETIFTLLHNLFLKVNIYTNNKEFLMEYDGNSFGIIEYYSMKDTFLQLIKNLLFVGNEQLAGAGWFFRVLFLISIIWVVADYVIKKISPSKRRCIKFFLLVIIAAIAEITNILSIGYIYNISAIFPAIIMFALGVYLHNEQVHMSRLKQILLFVASIIILLILLKTDTVEFSMNQYPCLGFMVLASLLGWTMLYLLSSYLSKFKVAKLFCYVGQHTTVIVFLHFLAFKIVNCIEVFCYNLPLFRIASYPVIKSRPFWWLLYTLLGVGVPLIFERLVMLFLRIRNITTCIGDK